jgi:hypothetical protein
LEDSLEVADFLVHYLEEEDGEEFGRISAQCTDDPMAYFEGTCGGCVCLTTGQVLCVDFTCDDIMPEAAAPGGQRGAPYEPGENFDSAPVNDEAEPASAEHGANTDSLAHPKPPTYPMGEGVEGPGTHTDELHPGYVEQGGTGEATLVTCEGGYLAGSTWEVGPNSCACLGDGTTACTLIGEPSTGHGVDNK